MTEANTEVKKESKFVTFLTNLADKVSHNFVMQTMQSAFMMVTPLLMIGSVFSMLAGLPINGYQTFLANAKLTQSLQLPYTYTYGWFSVYLTFGVAYQAARKKKYRKEAISIGMISIVNYLLMCPSDAITTWVGTLGLFMAILIGFLTFYTYTFAVKKNWVIKMPDSVPPAVANSFNAMIPGFCSILVAFLIHYIFSLTTIGDAQNALYSIIRAPLASLSGSVWTEVFLSLYTMLLWFFGIHGGAAVGPISSILFSNVQAENLAAYMSGETLPHMVTGSGIIRWYAMVCIAFLLFSKDEGNKEVAKVALVPGIFNLQEPLSFGIPLLMNPVFFIPYVFQNPLSTLLTKFFQVIGFLPYSNCLSLNWMIPNPIKNFLWYGWKGLVVEAIIDASTLLIYLPFIRINDKANAKKREQALGESEAAD